MFSRVFRIIKGCMNPLLKIFPLIPIYYNINFGTEYICRTPEV
jgi:hypothetical protein